MKQEENSKNKLGPKISREQSAEVKHGPAICFVDIARQREGGPVAILIDFAASQVV